MGHPDREISWPVDVRTLSSEQGYVCSFLAPIAATKEGTPLAALSGVTLFDAGKVTRLIEDVARRITARRSRFDLKRFANPLRLNSEQWRAAKAIEDLASDDSFADHVYDRLAEYDRARHREPIVLDLLGQPSAGLTVTVLGILERMEASLAPEWARMQVETWPAPTRLPKGFALDAAFPPRDGADVFVYLFRVYDIEHAAEVLPETYVRAFADEILRRGASQGLSLDDLLENGKPSFFTLSAVAEALARGIMSLTDVVPFLKKRVAEKRRRFLARTSQLATEIEPAAMLEVRRLFCEIAQVEHDFSSEELQEISLQFSVHPNDPSRVARILYGLYLQRSRTATKEASLSATQFGPLTLKRSELGR